MDLMAAFVDLVSTMTIVVTLPFSLIKSSCVFGVQCIFIIISTLAELLTEAVCLHVHIFWKLVVWTVAFVSLPARLLNALQRNRLMEMHLREMQDVLETILWEKKQLKERLKTALKERRMMEMMLAELEEEHDQAIVKIELLESKLQGLKDENKQLKEAQQKSQGSSTSHAGSGENALNTERFALTHEVYPWRSSSHGSNLGLQNPQKDIFEDENKVKRGTHHFVKDGSKSSPTVTSYEATDIISKLSNADDIIDQRRDIAVSRSLFSGVFSLLVGMIIWKADEPCMPLVVALFSVVGMSLKSVVEFFSTIKNKPASDAVALLSFSWFMLGTLTYPTLPKAARMFTPVVYKISNQMVWDPTNQLRNDGGILPFQFFL